MSTSKTNFMEQNLSKLMLYNVVLPIFYIIILAIVL